MLEPCWRFAHGAMHAVHAITRPQRLLTRILPWLSHLQRTNLAGWSTKPIHSHDPLAAIIAEPVNLQLVGSDGAGTHAVATLGDLIFDATEARALPLSRAALDQCVGAQLNGARFSHVARAVRLVPGKSVHTRMRRAERVRM